MIFLSDLQGLGQPGRCKNTAPNAAASADAFNGGLKASNNLKRSTPETLYRCLHPTKDLEPGG